MARLLVCVRHICTILLITASLVFASPNDFKLRTLQGHDLGRVFRGNAACMLQPMKEMDFQDLNEEVVRKLFAKCKPGASEAEIRDALRYIRELKEFFSPAKSDETQKGKGLKNAVRPIRGDRLVVVSRGKSYDKHGKSYGYKDSRTKQPFVYGEWYFTFNSVVGSATVKGTFPKKKVLSSSISKKCSAKLFRICLHRYVESNIRVQSTGKWCHRIWWLFFKRYCNQTKHIVHFTFYGEKDGGRGKCKCIKNCKSCTGH